MSTRDCPGGNGNFNINSNVQQIVRSIAIFKQERRYTRAFGTSVPNGLRSDMT